MQVLCIGSVALAVQVDGVTGQEFTYSQVAVLAARVAGGLRQLGVTAGDVLALYGHNSPQYGLVVLGAWMAGATVTGANPTYTHCQ